MTILLTTPVFAADKGMKFPVRFPGIKGVAESDARWESTTYIMDVLFPGAIKAKSPLTYAGKVYIPKSLFKNGGYLMICVDYVMYNKENGEEYTSYGEVNHRDWITIGRDASEKEVAIGIIDDKTGKSGAIGNKGSFKSVGSYYVLNFKNLRSMATYTKYGAKKNQEGLPIVTNKALYPMLNVIFHADFPKTVSGTIYIDQISVTGAKTLTASFEKQDWLFMDGRRSWSKVIPSVGNVPTK